MSGLRSFSETYYRKELDLSGSRLRDALVRECNIKSIRGAWLIDCDFSESNLDVQDIRDFLDATVTLNCFTFTGLKMSEMSFDAMAYLLSITSGNDEKRDRLRAMIDPTRLRLFDRVFPVIGTT